MEFTIRFANPSDVSEILLLINELAVFEKEPDAVEIDAAYLLKHGFGNKKSFTCLIAESTEEVLGMALFYNRFSTWKGITYHLEDLIVKGKYRKKGIGKALFEAFLNHAKKEKINRVEWVVLDWNTNAIEFYKSYHATIFDEWKTVQMDKDALQQLELK